jgi:hypothetical protein
LALLYFTKNLPLNCGDFQGGMESTDCEKYISFPTLDARSCADWYPSLVTAKKVRDFFSGSAGIVAWARTIVVTLEASGVYGIYVKRKIFTQNNLMNNNGPS